MSKGRATPLLRGPWLFAGAAALLLLLAGLLLLLRPRPVWVVEESLSADWGRVLREASPAPPFTRVAALSPEGAFSPKGRGFLITARRDRISGDKTGTADAPGETGPVAVYPWLSQTRQWRDALALAADPWMIFRKLGDPLPDRRRVEAPGSGVLICPGGEAPAVFAWISQLVQDSPGAFPGEIQRWQIEEENLFQGRRFQNGARNYTWVDVWPLLFRDNTAWVYAPLSLIRELPPYRMGLLEASRFPEKTGWNEYGVQADILWALPFGWKPDHKDLEAASEWLKDPAIQTLIANRINWVPAHPLGSPYNTVSWEAQMAWINSSFVWQGVENAKTDG
ncbi:MAG: hypothetical protein LBK27_07350 [Treponema sp.]|jgi:hypothetical protein|nr:hypothetical protein [Treponema sp.]